jgi:hypothetical protein
MNKPTTESGPAAKPETFQQKMKAFRFRNKTFRRPLILFRYRGITPQDNFLASYTRSGSTYLRFMLFEALTGESAEFGVVRKGLPSVGKQLQARSVFPGGGRMIQTHEPYSHGDRRVVYVVRDARSVVLSEYAWHQRMGRAVGKFDKFVEDFLRGRSTPWGSWEQHVKYWLDSEPARNDHLCLVKYEEIYADPHKIFPQVLQFLDSPLDDERVRTIIENNSLEQVRAKEDRAKQAGWGRKSDVRYVNKGASAGWRERLAPEVARKIETRFGSTLQRLGYEINS